MEWLAFGTSKENNGIEPNPVPSLLAAFEAHGVKTLLIEGGGHLMHLALAAQAVQELYLTVCPLLLGGMDNPALVAGPGFRISEAPRTEVISAEWRHQELYLHLKVVYPDQ